MTTMTMIFHHRGIIHAIIVGLSAMMAVVTIRPVSSFQAPSLVVQYLRSHNPSLSTSTWTTTTTTIVPRLKKTVALSADVPMMGRPSTTTPVATIATQRVASNANDDSSSNNNNSRRNKRNKINDDDQVEDDGEQQEEQEEHHFLLKKFMYQGQVIQPYDVLGVSRDADRKTIRAAYMKLSKKYHPDATRHRTILPGKCNNDEEVMEEWNRISYSYTILSNHKTRKRYDQSEMIAYPTAAFQRLAWKVTTNGLKAVGKGVLNLGSAAIETAMDVVATSSTTTTTTTTSTQQDGRSSNRRKP